LPTDIVQDLIAQASRDWEVKALLTGLTIFAGLLLKWLTVRIIRRRVHDPTVRLVWSQIANGSIGLTLVLVLSWIWLEGVGSILALLTLVAAAMTIVHKELIQNFSSWSIIAWRGLFRLGDYVEIGSNIGKVIDLGPMYFTLSEASGVEKGMRPTGRTVRVPNGQVLTHPVINYSDQSLRWVELDFTVASDADWQTALDILREIVDRESSEVSSDQKKATERGVTIAIKDNKVVLTAHFPTKPGKRFESQTRATTEALNRFKSAGISLA
jgi:small-conductance mechanosensitive channel